LSIKAVTFDLWDTVFADDTDEPRRAARGLLPKRAERRRLVHEHLSRHAPISREAVDAAYDAIDRAFSWVWHESHVTWSAGLRLSLLLQGLGRTLPDAEMAELTRLHEDMEIEERPDLAPGVREAIQGLRGGYRLGVVSDAIFSPGRALRALLHGYGLEECFEAFAFSDEVGCSKPEPAMFIAAADRLGVPMSEIVHLGDREQNDVKGPHAVGMKAVLVTVVKDRGSAATEADAVCRDYRDLPAIIAGL
jgi:putative hydrolase of the HAD superfamily